MQKNFIKLHHTSSYFSIDTDRSRQQTRPQPRTTHSQRSNSIENTFYIATASAPTNTTPTPTPICQTLRPCGARPGPLSLLRGRLWRPATSPSIPPSPLLTDAPPELVLENLLDLLDSTPENTEQLSMRFRSDEPPPVEEGDQGCSGFRV